MEKGEGGRDEAKWKYCYHHHPAWDDDKTLRENRHDTKRTIVAIIRVIYIITHHTNFEFNIIFFTEVRSQMIIIML